MSNAAGNSPVCLAVGVTDPDQGEHVIHVLDLGRSGTADALRRRDLSLTMDEAVQGLALNAAGDKLAYSSVSGMVGLTDLTTGNPLFLKDVEGTLARDGLSIVLTEDGGQGVLAVVRRYDGGTAVVLLGGDSPDSATAETVWSDAGFPCLASAWSSSGDLAMLGQENGSGWRLLHLKNLAQAAGGGPSPQHHESPLPVAVSAFGPLGGNGRAPGFVVAEEDGSVHVCFAGRDPASQLGRIDGAIRSLWVWQNALLTHLAYQDHLGLWLSDGTAKLRHVQALDSYSTVTAVVVSPEGGLLATGDSSACVRLWAIVPGQSQH
jgi:WD40 repeat protein